MPDSVTSPLDAWDIPRPIRLDRVLAYLRLRIDRWFDAASLVPDEVACRRACRLLGLRDDHHQATAFGRDVARLPDPEAIARLGDAFFATPVGVRWLAWAETTARSELRPRSARAFLTQCTTLTTYGVSVRTRTLEGWLQEIQYVALTRGLATLPNPLAAPPDRHAITRTVEAFLESQGITTLEGLVVWDTDQPDALPGLWKERRKRLRASVESSTGRSWDDLRVEALARRGDRSDPEAPIPSEPVPWNDLWRFVRESRIEAPIAHCPLPPALRDRARREGMRSVGDLISTPWSELLGELGLRMRTLEEAGVSILAPWPDPSVSTAPELAPGEIEAAPSSHRPSRRPRAPSERPSGLPRPKEPKTIVETREEGDLVDMIMASHIALRPRLGRVLSWKLGLDGQDRRPEAVLRELDIPRSTADYLVSRAFDGIRTETTIASIVGRELEPHLVGGLCPLEEVASHPLFARISDRPEAFEEVVRRLLAGTMHVVHVDGRWYVSRLDRGELGRLLVYTEREVHAHARDPIPRQLVAQIVHERAGEHGPAVEQLVLDSVLRSMQSDANGYVFAAQRRKSTVPPASVDYPA